MGKIIRIEVGEFVFERTSESPGFVIVLGHDLYAGEFKLPANVDDREAFIKAYRRAALEAIGYKNEGVEK
jgi:hypothetical protein